MPITLTAAQAERVAALARESGERVSLHQIADGADVYLAPAGEGNRYRIAASGEATVVEEGIPAGT
jgi:hypothetical protein